MNDVTIGRRAGAGMMQMKQRQEGSPRRVGRGAGQQGQRGSQEEADQTPRKYPVRRSESTSTDDDSDADLARTSPTRRRRPLYPSALTNASAADGSPNRTPKARRPQRGSRKDEEPAWQSLDELLRAAGYKDTRIVTPESERIQARVASEKRRREERGLLSEEEEDEELEVEALTKVDQDGGRPAEAELRRLVAAASPRQEAQVRTKPEPVHVEAGGWWTWMSLGRKAGADALDGMANPSDVKPAITRRRSALDLAPPSKPLTRPAASPPHLLNRASTSPPDSPSPRNRRQPTTKPVAASKRVTSLSSTECGSLSSSTSTHASTMVASPPDVPSRSFRPMEGSPVLEQGGRGEDGAGQWSPPRARNVGPVVVRGSERVSARSGDESEVDGRASRRANRAEVDVERAAERRGRDESTSTRASSTSRGSRPPVEKGKKIATTLDEDSLANSMAARSLRNISSQAALRATASSTSRIKPKASFSFGSTVSHASSSSSDVQAHPRRQLRHAASTPFFSTTSTTSVPPPLPTHSTQAVKQSWFSSVSRNFFPATIAEPTATDTAVRHGGNARIRARPSIPSFHPSTKASVPTPTTSLSSVSPRTDPLPTQVTQQTVLCSSEAADDDCGPSFSSFSALPPSESEQITAQAPPILSTKSSYSSTSSASSSASEGGDAWKKNLKGGGAGWTWNVSTAMEEDLAFWSAPSPVYPTTDEPPPSRPLQAKRSIKSLRAALAASDLAESLLNAPPMPTTTPARKNSSPMLMGPPPPPPEIVISSPGTFEAGIAPRVLDLDDEDDMRARECFGGTASRRPLGGRGAGRVIRKRTVL